MASILAKRGVHSVEDLLNWYPRAYEDRRKARNIASLKPGELVSLKAQVLSIQSVRLGKSVRKMYDVVLRDDSGKIHCKFFRVPYKGYFDRFEAGQWVRVVGKVTHYRSSIEFHHPDIRDIETEEETGLIPLYTETEGLSPNKLRTIIDAALVGIQGKVGEKLPAHIVAKYQLPSREEALRALHQPPEDALSDFVQCKSAFHRRIVFEEFFWLELFLAARHSELRKDNAPEMKENYVFVEKMHKRLPFQLTNAQKKVLKEIFADLRQSHPMHRLVQGDVGSGKTVVALLSACFVAASGYQSALMVPTEILADQHFKNATKFLEPLGLHVALLTGSQTAKERREVLEHIAHGDISLVVGTHALIQEDVHFRKLGLVIIDEQHRFGVEQRGSLKEKGVSPHFLVMTATPIPRTLAMTVYGDLDVSVIDQMPEGRTPIVTRVVYESKRAQVMSFMVEQVEKGRQAYVVYPLVEESEKIDLKDAVSEFEKLQKQFPKIRFALLHGRMKDVEKESVMQKFRAREFDVLVATTVIEVGVDVPNANLMIIEHTERFGLSQLHQLRGRVGRGEHKSYCVLMLGHAVSDESRQRADIMARTTNGFEIAEADLEMRGPGEFLGTRQSGLAGFKLANLVRDVVTLQEARQAAFAIFQDDPGLKKLENSQLRHELLKTHGPTALAGIG